MIRMGSVDSEEEVVEFDIDWSDISVYGYNSSRIHDLDINAGELPVPCLRVRQKTA